MIRVLFVHQNLPGQFRRLINHLQSNPAYELTGIGERTAVERERFPENFRAIAYDPSEGAGQKTHHYLKHFEACIRRGQTVIRACMALKDQGYRPDVIVCHPGWGEGLFLKDIFPQSKLVVFCEFYWAAHGLDVGFDPEYPATLDDTFRIRIQNSVLIHSLLAADAAVTPTEWQRSVHPPELLSKIRVVHEGIDTRQLKPNPDACLTLADGTRLSRETPVLTYVARNLEPYRGFHVFMRALPAILSANRELHVVITGGDGVSYGKRPPSGFATYREAMIAELGNHLDWSRVHFTGKIPYAAYISLLQLSSLHVYLTYPFVLSWSMLEAMAAGVPVLASATPPVQEVIRDGENGFLFDFFDVDGLARKVIDFIDRRKEISAVGMKGRETVVRDYDFETTGLPVYLELLQSAQPVISSCDKAEKV